MEMKKTLTLSALLHVILFSAALLLFRGSRNMQAEDLFFVNLTEDIKMSGSEEAAAKIKKPAPSLPLKEETPKPLSDVQLKNDINTEQEPVINASSSEEISVNVANSGEKEITAATTTSVINDYNTYHGNGHIDPLDKRSDGKDKGSLPDGIIAIITNAIERTKAYPLQARKRGMEGTVYVSFKIAPDGKPEGITTQKSSGFGILDTATLDVIKKAAPFPYIENRVEIPVTYKLKNLN